jgi:hypothetical protein
MTAFQRLLLVQVLRPDRLASAMAAFAAEALQVCRCFDWTFETFSVLIFEFCSVVVAGTSASRAPIAV